ncbi:MAG: type II secretion system protein [Candidatus Shapirobacteria bacterium]|nr:type II secretion system protein [Candidatus Shapirobacteria bacterium]
MKKIKNSKSKIQNLGFAVRLKPQAEALRNVVTKGFTMIELLIVIAVLGILAVAVLATINPIEQINRGRDTGSRSDAEQLLSAIDRYNATQGIWPWQAIKSDDDAVVWQLVSALNDADNCPLLDKLAQGGGACTSGADEVKAAFTARLRGTTYNSLWMEYGGEAGNSVYICFQPQSGSFRTEAQRRCNEGVPVDFPTGADCATCISTPTACYICLP